jgi:hypothetical protein
MPRVELFAFRYRDPRTGRWLRARYKATLDDIARRHAEWGVTGPAEIRTPIGRWFNPYQKLVTHAELQRLEEPPLTMNPHHDRPPGIDQVECAMVALFLRRYVTFCARRKRYAEMQGAAKLHREIIETWRVVAS